jgi:hypothetical protein
LFAREGLLDRVPPGAAGLSADVNVVASLRGDRVRCDGGVLVVCETCGEDAVGEGAGHACELSGGPLVPTAAPVLGAGQPPIGWRAVTWLVFGLAGLHFITAAVYLVLAMQDYTLVQRVTADPGGVAASEIFALAGQERTANRIFQVVFLGYIAAYVLWFFVTRQTAERYGGDRRAIARHWTLTVWRVAIVAAILLRYNPGAQGSTTDLTGSGEVDSLLALDRHTMLYLAGRFPIAALLVAGVWVVRGRVRALAANPRTPTPTGAATRRTQPTVPLAAEAPQVPEPHRRADAHFWNEVTHWVARAETLLPLLEIPTAGPRSGRWHLLVDESAVTAARAAVQPGSVITVFSQPPLLPDEPGLTRLADEARHLLSDPACGGAAALIEDDSGLVRFDHLDLWVLAEKWLSRARTATRAGLYPGRPGAAGTQALTAEVPPS